MLASTTVQRVKFFEDFYCLGFDLNKVKNGIEDLTELSSIDNSRDWNKGLVACKIKYYKDLGKTKKQVKKMILDIAEIPEIK